MRVSWLFLPVLLLVANGCVHSRECRQAISDCLRNCQSTGIESRVPNSQTGPGNDSRTICERNCEGACGGNSK